MQNFNQNPNNNQTNPLQLESKQVQEKQNKKMENLWDSLLVKKSVHKTCDNCDAVNAEADKQCRVCGHCMNCL